MSVMMKIAIAALAAGIAQAKPVNVASGPNSYTNPSKSSAAWSSSTSAASYTTGGSNSGSQTTGFPEFVSATAVPSAVAALAKEINADLTQVDRLQQLLSVDNDSKVPLTDPKAVHDAIAFDFKTAPVGGDGGRILVANEANFPFLVGEGIAGAVELAVEAQVLGLEGGRLIVAAAEGEQQGQQAGAGPHVQRLVNVRLVTSWAPRPSTDSRTTR